MKLFDISHFQKLSKRFSEITMLRVVISRQSNLSYHLYKIIKTLNHILMVNKILILYSKCVVSNLILIYMDNDKQTIITHTWAR